ncbi:unnamed protein product, partial [Polarella glacialis]
GSVKSFNGAKGFGFVDCGTGTDVFVHIKDCTDGAQPAAGDVLRFDLEPSTSKQGQMPYAPGAVQAAASADSFTGHPAHRHRA